MKSPKSAIEAGMRQDEAKAMWKAPSVPARIA